MRALVFVVLWFSVVLSYDGLLTDWTLQTSAKVSDDGAVISKAGYDDSNWYSVTVPATVMAGLVENEVYKDLFFSDNLKAVDTKQFDVPWWYRTQFKLPASDGKTVRLIFEGINYRADVWVNGKQVASQADVAGAFRYFEFDVSGSIVFDTAPNALAVAIYRPYNSIINDSTTDLAITFVDWSPIPPDGNMGIWRDVRLISTPGPLTVNYPAVDTKLSGVDLAHLTVFAEVTNWLSTSVMGTLEGSIAGIGTFSQPISLKANEVQTVFFSNATFPVLNVNKPQLWWPW